MDTKEFMKAVGRAVESLWRLKGKQITEADFDLIISCLGRFKPETLSEAIRAAALSRVPSWELLAELSEICEGLEPEKAEPKIRTEDDLRSEARTQFQCAIEAIKTGYAKEVVGFTADGMAAAEMVPSYTHAKSITGDPTEFEKYGKKDFFDAYVRRVQNREEHDRLAAIKERKKFASLSDRSKPAQSAAEVIERME